MPGPDDPVRLPDWARELSSLYESGANSQFLLYGNVTDRLLLPGSPPMLGELRDYLVDVLMPRFDVVLSYDIGNGIRIERGGEIFADWPAYKTESSLPRAPGAAVDTLTHYFRYLANLGRMGRARVQVGCFLPAAHLLAPAGPGGSGWAVNALALLIRDWASERLLSEHTLATFLISENLNDLHPLIVNNPRLARVRIPLPTPRQLERALVHLAPRFPLALSGYRDDPATPARQLAGASFSAVESLLRIREHRRRPLDERDLSSLKKELVENEANGLIEFVAPHRTLDDLYGLSALKAWLRQDLKLWRAGEREALPMGYLLCGPVGTGKSFLVECLAGEAGVPVVRLKNFRDRWVGSSEGNLERIFRLLHALGRCYVFIDEADQALGRRSGGSGDSGVSGRLYSMLAEEMARPANRGHLLWVLASSRPDLIEVDLKRPGRVDVKMPLLPTASPAESLGLVRALCARKGLEIPADAAPGLEQRLPPLLTPAAAEALAVKVYRRVRTSELSPLAALEACLGDYRPPVAPEILAHQIRLALQEASDPDLIPAYFLQHFQIPPTASAS